MNKAPLAPYDGRPDAWQRSGRLETADDIISRYRHKPALYVVPYEIDMLIAEIERLRDERKPQSANYEVLLETVGLELARIPVEGGWLYLAHSSPGGVALQFVRDHDRDCSWQQDKQHEEGPIR